MNKYIQEKQGTGKPIRKKTSGLFHNGIFEVTEISLSADGIIFVKLTLKGKLNKRCELDKLKTRGYLRGDMQIKINQTYGHQLTHQDYLDVSQLMQPRSMLKCINLNPFKLSFNLIYKNRIFVILDYEYEQFCPILKKYLGRPLR